MYRRRGWVTGGKKGRGEAWKGGRIGGRGWRYASSPLTRKGEVSSTLYPCYWNKK